MTAPHGIMLSVGCIAHICTSTDLCNYPAITVQIIKCVKKSIHLDNTSTYNVRISDSVNSMSVAITTDNTLKLYDVICIEQFELTETMRCKQYIFIKHIKSRIRRLHVDTQQPVEIAHIKPVQNNENSSVQSHKRRRDSSTALISNKRSASSIRKDETIQQLKQQLQELTQCYICIENIDDPVQCPTCSKSCCRHCITEWLQKKSKICPHCKTSITVDQLVIARHINDIETVINSMPLYIDLYCNGNKFAISYTATDTMTAIQERIIAQYVDKNATPHVELGIQYIDGELKVPLPWFDDKRTLHDILDDSTLFLHINDNAIPSLYVYTEVSISLYHTIDMYQQKCSLQLFVDGQWLSVRVGITEFGITDLLTCADAIMTNEYTLQFINANDECVDVNDITISGIIQSMHINQSIDLLITVTPKKWATTDNCITVGIQNQDYDDAHFVTVDTTMTLKQIAAQAEAASIIDIDTTWCWYNNATNEWLCDDERTVADHNITVYDHLSYKRFELNIVSDRKLADIEHISPTQTIGDVRAKLCDTMLPTHSNPNSFAIYYDDSNTYNHAPLHQYRYMYDYELLSTVANGKIYIAKLQINTAKFNVYYNNSSDIITTVELPRHRSVWHLKRAIESAIGKSVPTCKLINKYGEGPLNEYDDSRNFSTPEYDQTEPMKVIVNR